jgi:DNA-binding transcriptional ArsR family regulator
MVEVLFDVESISGVRFGISPLMETALSVRALTEPAGSAVHLPWLDEARRLTAGLDLEPIKLLWRRGAYTPDFLHPPPAGPTATFEDELAAMAATPAAQVRFEVRRCYDDAALPAALQPFIARPRAALRELAELFRRYWQLVLAEHWPRIASLIEHDILYRARRLADGGTRELFADLDPSISWEEHGLLRIDKKQCAVGEGTTLALDERGLLLLPTAFAWPKVLLVTEPPWQPTVIYPARGVGMLWEPERPASPEALTRLLGGSRASILTALDRPRSTTELARVLEMSPGGVSQHLSVLHSAGLVSRRRDQRVVLYLRSHSGEGLMQTAAAARA